MILSVEINFQKDLDLISFSSRENAIHAPVDEWFSCLCSSLRMKHSVLITETLLNEIPSIDTTKRWVVGDNWCWLAPRSLSVITAAYKANPMTFSQFIEFLRSSK